MTKALTNLTDRSPKLDGSCCGAARRARINARYGFTLVELIGTCVLLGILFSTTIPMLLVIARERKATEQRQFALQHVANLIESAAAKPWAELSPGNLPVPDVDADLRSVLPGLERTITVKQVDGEPESRQIVASIRWQSRTGEFVSPLKLSTWVFSISEVR